MRAANLDRSSPRRARSFAPVRTASAVVPLFSRWPPRPRGPRPALPPLITQCILRHGARQTRPRQQQSGTNDDRSPARRRRADDGREREVVSGGLASVSCAGACNCCSEGEASVTSEAGWRLGSAAARAEAGAGRRGRPGRRELWSTPTERHGGSPGYRKGRFRQ